MHRACIILIIQTSGVSVSRNSVIFVRGLIASVRLILFSPRHHRQEVHGRNSEKGVRIYFVALVRGVSSRLTCFQLRYIIYGDYEVLGLQAVAIAFR